MKLHWESDERRTGFLIFPQPAGEDLRTGEHGYTERLYVVKLNFGCLMITSDLTDQIFPIYLGCKVRDTSLKNVSEASPTCLITFYPD